VFAGDPYLSRQASGDYVVVILAGDPDFRRGVATIIMKS
jgi:hypothetical protein